MNQYLSEIEKFNMDDLEMGEVADMEDVCGCSAPQIDFASAKALLAMHWIMRRRKDPDYTIEEARRVKFAKFIPEEEDTNGDRPTKAAKGGSKAKSKPVASGDPS